MQSPNNPPLIDSKTIVALILGGAVFFGWQQYMHWKYPTWGKPEATAVISKESTSPTQTTNSQPATKVDQTPNLGTQTLEKQPEVLIGATSATLNFSISSQGMGLKNIVLNNFTDHENLPIALGRSDQNSLFELNLGNEPVIFNVKKTGDNQFLGEAKFGQAQIRREISFDPDTYSFKSKTIITQATEGVVKGIKFLIPEQITAKASTSFLFPSYEHQDLYVDHEGKNDVVNFSAAQEDLNKEYKSTSLVSLSSQYFATAFVDKSEISPEMTLKSKVSNKTALAEIVYKPANLKDSFQFDQTYYVGPKSIDILTRADSALPDIINFGWFGVIARPLLYIMKAFHSVVGNWGLAIILLTLLVRLVVLPFNLMSFKSMKAMQKIQPLMASVRERYKDDPVRMNQEVMALMKEHKANPLGGCLPMLLQIPIFFALYRVIGSSIELYKSPFFGWIHDLSGHDPYYILPVLMGATMFVQQKLTPTNMDPAQAKIMAFLPLVFSVFMLQLPSGLTLYMFVSGLFGITQQWFMLKKKA